MTTKPIHIALFTDTYDEVNGVANTFRHLTEYCRKTNRHLDIYTHATDKDSVEESGSVYIHRYKPAAPVDIYFDMIFDLKLPRLRLFNEFRKRHYDLIHTATSGSMGLNALALARLDKIPLISSYHTSLPEYVRNRVEKIVQKFHLSTEHAGEWVYKKLLTSPTQTVLTRLSIQAALTVLAIMVPGIALMLFWSTDPQQAVIPVISAGLICLVMTIISLIPLTVATRAYRDWLGHACLAGTTIRLLLTLFAGLAIYTLVIASRQKMAFVLWSLCFYLVLLVWETITSVRIIKMFQPLNGTNSKTP